MADSDLIELTAAIVESFVGGNSVPTTDVPALISSTYAALAALGAPAPAQEPEKPKGAVSARASIKADGLISMIDGRKYQTLRRHITRHGYTPESYRETFGLPRDYPLTSSNYSELRRGMAKSIGLGRKAAVAAPEPEPEPVKPPRKARAAKAIPAAAEAPAPVAPLIEAETLPAAPPAGAADKPKRGRPAKAKAPTDEGQAIPIPADKPKRGRPPKAKAGADDGKSEAVGGTDTEF